MEQETLNLTELILNSINEIFSKLFSSVDNNLYTLLDELAFIKTDILSNSYFKKIIGQSNYEGILLITNSLLFGFILYYSINYLFSHLTYSKIDSPKQFIFKTIIFVAIMNSSIWICEEIINIIALITDAISLLSYNLFDKHTTFSNFIDNINKITFSSLPSFNIFSFQGILKSFISFGLTNLVFSYSLRYIMIQIWIIISPFAFLSLILNSTEWFFRAWIKTFFSLLLTQILISIILLLSFSIEPTSFSTYSQILYVGILFALTKANNYMKEILGGISTNIQMNVSKNSIF